MANRYWVGGTGTWDGSSTTHWSASSGGASGASVPTAADDVFFDANSGGGTVAISATGCVCRSLDCTGAPATTIAWTSVGVLAIGDASGGAMKLVNNISFTSTGGTAAINFLSTSSNGGTGWNVQTAGKTVPALTFNGAGGQWTFQGALTSAGAITLTAGTLDTNGQTVTATTFSSSNSNTRILTLGSSSITLTSTSSGNAWNVATATNLTVTTNTATVTMSATTAAFASGGINYNGLSLVFTGAGAAAIGNSGCTFANITRTGTATKTDIFMLVNVTVTGAFTVNGNSATNRMFVQTNSGTIGVTRTVTAATVSITNSDFQDITGAGAANWNLSSATGGSGDCAGNSGITFTTPTTRYGVVAGNWSSTATWSTTSGGAGGASVPLPQDDVFLDASSAAGTYTTDMPRAGKNIDCTGFTRTLSGTTQVVIFGSLTLAGGMTLTWTAGGVIFQGRGTHTITSAGKTIVTAVAWTCPGATYTLQDAFNTSGSLTVNDGTWNTNNQSVTCSSFAAASTRATTLNFGTTVVTLTFNGTSTVWNTATSATIITGTVEVVISTASSGTRTVTIVGANGKLDRLTYTVPSSTGILSLQTSSTSDGYIRDLNIGPGHNLSIVASRRVHIQTMTSGTAGNLVSIVSGSSGVASALSRQYIEPQGNVYTFNGGAVAKDGYLLVDGIDDYVTCPKTAAFDITGDLDVRADIAPDDWTPTISGNPVARYGGTAASLAFRFVLATTGNLNLAWSPDGTTTLSRTSTVGLGALPNGTRRWVRATLDVDDGAGNHVVRFYWSSVENPQTSDWTLLDTVTTAGTTLIQTTTKALEIGANQAGASGQFAGKIYKAELRNGINGTIVTSPDFTGRSYQIQDYLSLKDSAATGYGVWYAGSHSTNVSGNTGWIFDDPQREGWGVLL